MKKKTVCGGLWRAALGGLALAASRLAAAEPRPLTDFRYVDQFVTLEKLDDKGLTYAQVAPKQPITMGRPKPVPPFALTARKPGATGNVDCTRVPVRLLEEGGVARRTAAVTFGFPLPSGAVFDPAHLRLLAPGGVETPAQFAVTSFWPDDSLKWVLVDFQIPLAARAESEFMVEFGNAVQRKAAAAAPLEVTESGATLTIATGPLKAEVDKRHFNVLRQVWLDGRRVAAFADDGLRLLDEHGKLFTTAARPPESVRLEERGPEKVVVRVEGAYAAADGATYMRYIARLTFRAGSPRVTLALTHVNDYLQTEFTDVTALTLPLAANAAEVYLPTPDGKLAAHAGRTLQLFQSDEKTSELHAGTGVTHGGRAPGVARCGTMLLVLHDFWQRWPKGFTANDAGFSIDLLPPQPDATFGRGLPHYLLFPFVSGKYRFKWGMAFTERVTFDFAGAATPEELCADANQPLVAVIPADWYARTGALGLLAAPRGQQFAAWDDFLAASLKAVLAGRDLQREYGYFNYGDWYGERGRNWGNNEYDTAHGYFMQFARTGQRAYFRLAFAAARHQADVDCVHAYPDPYYVGANHQHSIGHTGMWSERAAHGTWTHRYDAHTAAANGHTWADGLMDAWYLTGDAGVMEGALGIGEHIAWAMSRDFKQLGTHERSAGWSLKAIMALYRGTHDPVYLEAAARIAAVALREQKFEDGGAWPHVLPGDHAGAQPGVRGNNLFLIGVLLGGLMEYHQATHDPAVQRSLIAGAGWVMKSWDENAEAWPYSATTAGAPLFKPNNSISTLIIEPLAYVGLLTGDARFVNAAETALGNVVRGGPEAFGKAVAQKMVFTSGTLALLQQWATTHRPDGGTNLLARDNAGLERSLPKVADATRHAVRGPNQKVFHVQLRTGAAELVATRTPFGAAQKRAAEGSLKISGGPTCIFSTDEARELRCPLSGVSGTVFRVVIRDDQRGVWTLDGGRLGLVMQTVPGFSIGGVGRGRYHFFVPAGTAQFSIKLSGGHNGAYGGAALTPDNRLSAFYQGVRLPVAPSGEHPERGELVVKPAPQDTGKLWSLVLWAAGDIGCELQGVPPYLARTAAEWFAPASN